MCGVALMARKQKKVAHTVKMTSYILRGFDPDLWHRIKVKALSEKVTVKDVLIRLAREWVNE
jgi:hypothetical protein